MDREGVPSEDGLFLVRLGVVLSERCKRTRAEAALAEELFSQWEVGMEQRASGRAGVLSILEEAATPPLGLGVVEWGRSLRR